MLILNDLNIWKYSKLIHFYLFEVKKPAESKGPYDYYKVAATIPAAEAFRPLNEGDCPLVKK